MPQGWRPIPGSTQELAIDTRADQTLFCGTRGCGKTAAQLMLFRRMAAQHGEACVGIILDTEYKALDNIVAQSHKIYRDSGKFNSAKADYYWLFPNGARLLFRAVRSEDACSGYLGHEYAFIGFNELTKWPTGEVYNTMMGSLRTADKAISSKVFSTTNPFGVGKIWCKRKFIDPVPYGITRVETIEVPLPYGEVHTEEKSIISLRGNYSENPFFSYSDIANLLQGVADNPAKYAAWIECNWDAAGGNGAINDLWDRDVHVLPDFPVPDGWYIDRCFDWGSTDPFSVGWFAVANGEDVLYNSKTISLPRGSVVQVAEWYGCPRGADNRLDIGKNRGLRLTPREIADGIISRETEWKQRGVFKSKVFPGAADTNIRNVHRSDVETIEKTMRRFGVYWLAADKAAGSRVQGLQAMRTRLRNALNNDKQGYYVMRKCQATIETLPYLEREDEDIAQQQEDHVYDMTRYRLLNRRSDGSFKANFPVGDISANNS